MSHYRTNAEKNELLAAASGDVAQVRMTLQGGFLRGASAVLTGLERLQANLTRLQVLERIPGADVAALQAALKATEPLLAQAGGFLARWQHSLAEQGLVGDAYGAQAAPLNTARGRVLAEG